MNKIMAFLAVLSFSNFSFAAAPAQDWGVGVEVGSISTLSAQRSYSPTAAVMAGAGVDADNFIAYGDHVWYMPETWRVHPYLGLGAGLRVDDDQNTDDLQAMFRVPAGVSYYTARHPLNLYGQVVPSFVSEGDTAFEAQIGLRYLFQ